MIYVNENRNYNETKSHFVIKIECFFFCFKIETKLK